MTHSSADANYCALPLAVYATRPDMSRGRLIVEADSRHRTPFQRDRDRIIHCNAFRRLKYKTQVFVHHDGDDHYRTRLTHSLEVAQIARTLARVLLVNEDLVETIALAHDLGHTPFAHVGGDALDVVMQPYGGFDHNDQSLRVVTKLERRYPTWDGLNLSWETLEGLAKHNGPRKGRLPFTIAQISQVCDLRLQEYASLEAQIVDFADDIAYNNHDVEDGLRVGLFTLDQLENEVDLYKVALPRIRGQYPGIDQDLLVKEAIREMIGVMLDDVIQTTQANLRALNITSPDDVRQCGQPVVGMSPDLVQRIRQLRKFLYDNMYMNPLVRDACNVGASIVQNLFTAFMQDHNRLPENLQSLVKSAADMDQARIVADYIAGMTDRFATKEYQNMFDPGH